MQQLRCEDKARDANENGNRKPYDDGLDSGDGRACGILFANAAGDHGRGGQANPKPTAKTRLSSDSVRPTVATASAPRRPTQKTSTTAKRDSSTISRTIGMARRKMARLRLPVVKSWCEPRSASRMDCQIGMGLGSRVELLRFH